MCRPRGHLAINFDPSTLTGPAVIKGKKRRKKSAFLSIGLEMAKKKPVGAVKEKQYPTGLNASQRALMDAIRRAEGLFATAAQGHWGFVR